MGTAALILLHHHQSLLHPVSSSSYETSPGITSSAVSSPRTHLNLWHQNVLRQQPMKYLILKRIATAAFTHSFTSHLNLPKLFVVNCTMADDSKSISDKSTILKAEEGEDGKKLEKSTPPRCIPSPPEKPLPDDCCGSGCVRCVWDIYYEELEEYNKLYKNKTSPGHSSKQS